MQFMIKCASNGPRRTSTILLQMFRKQMYYRSNESLSPRVRQRSAAAARARSVCTAGHETIASPSRAVVIISVRRTKTRSDRVDIQFHFHNIS